MRHPSVVFLYSCIALCMAPATAQQQAASDYPNRNVRVVVGYPPGGTPDITFRILAPKLQERTGQAFIIDNRPGASAQVGTLFVVKSEADGYTLLAGETTLAISAALNPKLPYDTIADLAAVARTVVGANVLTVPLGGPKNVAELIATAKAKPGQLNYGSTGNGTASQLCMEFLKKAAGVNIFHVPYKGGAPAMTAVVGGETQMACASILLALPHIASGKIAALAVTSPRRSASLPHVPTVAESGLPGFEVTTWFGVLAPSKTPAAVITRLNALLVSILNTQDVQERMIKIGLEAAGSTPEEFAALISSDVKKWTTVVREAQIKAE